MIKVKPKECSFCGELKILWKSNPKACKECWGKNKDKPSAQAKPRKSIKPVSDKMAERLKIYRKKRDQYFKENPECEYPGCESREVTLHHRAGRVGDLLCDERYFCSLCMKHHSLCETNPDHAKKLGLSLDRLSID